jgi:tRNA (cmo5U34)-methyltransferase
MPGPDKVVDSSYVEYPRPFLKVEDVMNPDGTLVVHGEPRIDTRAHGEPTHTMAEPPDGPSINHHPIGDKWEFDQSVADVFTDMLERSIPGYETMRELVLEIGSRFVSMPNGGHPTTEIVDLGCANGLMLERFVKKFGATATYWGVDASEAMVNAAHERFKGLIESGIVRIGHADLRGMTGALPAARMPNLILSVLTLCFVPINYRQRIIRSVAQSMPAGGKSAFILVEKVLGDGPDIDDAFVGVHETRKAKAGYSGEAIARKKASLEGVLVPVTAGMNETLLRQAGFTQIDCFWRTLNFAGWLAVK